MKIIKFLTNFVLIIAIIALMVWAGMQSNKRKCNAISILIHCTDDSKILCESDIINILEQHNIEWKDKIFKEINTTEINKILANENYIETVNKIHFSGSKLQIEISLFDIMLQIETSQGEKFLLDTNGVSLPYSPKIGNNVILLTGLSNHKYEKKSLVTYENGLLFDAFSLATLIKKDSFFSSFIQTIYINPKQEMVLYSNLENIPIVFGTIGDAESKLTTLKLMYSEVLPYVNENKYTQIDVRFKNRIITTKNKT